MESFELNNGHILLRIHCCRYFRIEGLRFQGFRNISSSWIRQIAMGDQHHEELPRLAWVSIASLAAGLALEQPGLRRRHGSVSSSLKLPPIPASGHRTAGYEHGLRGPFARLGYLERLARYLWPPAPGRAASRTAGLLRLLGRLLGTRHRRIITAKQ